MLGSDEKIPSITKYFLRKTSRKNHSILVSGLRNMVRTFTLLSTKKTTYQFHYTIKWQGSFTNTWPIFFFYIFNPPPTKWPLLLYKVYRVKWTGQGTIKISIYTDAEKKAVFLAKSTHNVITYIVKMNSFVVIPAIISIKVRTSSLFIFKSFFK